MFSQYRETLEYQRIPIFVDSGDDKDIYATAVALDLLRGGVIAEKSDCPSLNPTGKDCFSGHRLREVFKAH
jgi:hypothetical protein